jgi:hypothetical protein
VRQCQPAKEIFESLRDAAAAGEMAAGCICRMGRSLFLVWVPAGGDVGARAEEWRQRVEDFLQQERSDTPGGAAAAATEVVKEDEESVVAATGVVKEEEQSAAGATGVVKKEE